MLGTLECRQEVFGVDGFVENILNGVEDWRCLFGHDTDDDHRNIAIQAFCADGP